MPLARPRANSLSIPIPTAAFWCLRRPPTPRRATHPLPANYDIPPVPPLSFWVPETPSPFPTNSPAPTSPISSSPTPASCCSQSGDPSPPPHLKPSTSTSDSRKLLLPPISPPLPSSPRSPISPQSPHNPFLSPPLPRWNATALFTLASPLLPASPLSIFDRAISPTSPTFLLSRTPSPVTPNWADYTFLRTATPSLAEEECEEKTKSEGQKKDKGGDESHADLSPTFLCPRTAPVPQMPIAAEPTPNLERSHSTTSTALLNSTAETTTHPEREKMKLEFYHFLAARRVATMQTLCTPHAASPPSKRRLARWWEKLVPRAMMTEESKEVPRRRGRFSGWSGFLTRA
ncbi:hypothetical protein M3J09_011115 [Ascochyta lentis]